MNILKNIALYALKGLISWNRNCCLYRAGLVSFFIEKVLSHHHLAFFSVSGDFLVCFYHEKCVPCQKDLSAHLRAIYPFHKMFRVRVHNGLMVSVTHRLENFNFFFDVSPFGCKLHAVC